ncbi:S9 family peptidase [Phototrophicus methaneseepsis]|uniref:S9 family peptidase n=1 Tax=Phototrophicus methaneseepsis TaxID=2710758 RepID=A0A7S8EDE7_9CHLR|nr:S9 family peptidase [Phototrophicus methaneseepsis]QPC84933.1 S9 family peptidase [Phototrophicus methaneseepsis]
MTVTQEATQEKRHFGLLDDLHYARIGSARLSPDGKWVVYERTQPDAETEKTSRNLWRINLATGESRQLTYDDSSSAPEWSPDGKSIAFLSGRSGKPQIYLLPTDGGEARQITDFMQGIAGGPTWSPDGKSLAFTAGPAVEPRDPSDPYTVTRFIYRFDGIGYLDDHVRNIFVLTLADGSVKQLTDDAQMNRTLRWSPSGDEILYLASHDPDSPKLFYSKIRVVTMDGDIEEILGLDWGFIKNADWSEDGKKIIFASAVSDHPMATKDDLWEVARSGGTPVNLTSTMENGVEMAWHPAHNADKMLYFGDSARVCVAESGKKGIYAISLTGEPDPQQLLGGERTLSLLDANDTHMLFLSSTLENPGELHIANLDGTDEKPITHVNEAHMAGIIFPEVEHLLYTNEDGDQVEGWMLLPPGGEAPYPTVLYIHGGPHGWYGHKYTSDFQMLAGAGYAVLFVNPRGSTGYGDDYASALSGHWGVMDYKDLMAGVDYAIEQGLADPDKLGVCGLSYGGFMTTFTVGQTRRFKAAVAENPITDLVSRYGTADMGPWGSLSELGGKPHEIPEVYKQSSPITYAHLCTTPTLLVQGEDDYRCPIGQGEQFYAHLKANGCPTEMVRLPGMSHVASISGPVKVQKAQNEATLNWLNKYILGIS